MTLEKSKRITGKERTKHAHTITRQYQKGTSIRQIAEATGRSYGWVHKILTENKIPLRPQGGNNYTKKETTTNP